MTAMTNLPARRSPDAEPSAHLPVVTRGLKAVRAVPLVPSSRDARGRAWLRPAVCLPVPPACRSVWSVTSALSAAGAGNVLAVLPARLLFALTWAAAALAVSVSAAVALVVLAGRGVRRGRREQGTRPVPSTPSPAQWPASRKTSCPAPGRPGRGHGFPAAPSPGHRNHEGETSRS